jgi:hypothetical protein
MLRAVTTLTVKRRVFLGGWKSSRTFRLLSSSSPTTAAATTTHAATTTTDTVKVEQTKSRRRQRQGRLSINSPESSIPSYKEFVHRFTVVRLYRNFLKAIRTLPHNQEDLRAQVQREFGVNKKDANPFNIKRALAEGQRKYAELQDFTGAKNPSQDSWINTKDEQDPRGRVGEGWPWSQ